MMSARQATLFAVVSAVLLGIILGVGVVVGLTPPAPARTSGEPATPTMTSIPAVVNNPEAPEPDAPSPAATATPSPAATAAPTTAPNPSATPQPTPDPAAVVALEQIRAASAALRSGHLDAVREHRDGGRTMEVLRFDLGDAQREPRLLRVTTTGTTTTELLMVGNRAWQRQGDSTWTAVANQPSIQAQVQAFLPDVAAATQLRVAPDTATTVVQWYAADDDVDVTVRLAADEPVLQELRYVPRSAGPVLTVTYHGWNTYVDIIAPDGT